MKKHGRDRKKTNDRDKVRREERDKAEKELDRYRKDRESKINRNTVIAKKKMLVEKGSFKCLSLITIPYKNVIFMLDNWVHQKHI